MLGRFGRDLKLLSSVSILPAAQTQQYKCLGDLVPEEQYSDWAVKCSATHENLVKRVGQHSFHDNHNQPYGPHACDVEGAAVHGAQSDS